MTTELAPVFLVASPLADGRRRAEADLRGQTTPSELAWLHANPLLWLKALDLIDRDIQNSIGKSRLKLAVNKPVAGEHASPEYLEVKAEHDLRHLRRLHFRQLVVRRREEVLAILGPRPVLELLTRGDVLGALSATLLLLEDGEPFAACAKLRSTLERWSR